MGKFDKYKGVAEFEFDGEQYSIRVKTEHLQELVKLASDFKRTNVVDLVKLKEIYTALLKGAYPAEDPEKISAFLDVKLLPFHAELLVASGITTKKDLEEMAKKMEAEMSDFLFPGKASAVPGTNGKNGTQ